MKTRINWCTLLIVAFPGHQNEHYSLNDAQTVLKADGHFQVNSFSVSSDYQAIRDKSRVTTLNTDENSKVKF